MKNRELKFRVWDKEKNHFHLPEYFDELSGGSETSRTDKSIAFFYLFDYNERYIIQQFTGLLDKNNKEIYEGDIIKNENKLSIVEWQGARWLCPNDASGEADLSNISWDIEIIGNIFENPELLNVL